LVKTVSNFGEFTLIERIKQILPQTTNSDVLVGIGDDTAVIRIAEDRALIVTCDIQVEDQHFRLKNISGYQLGRRAIAVNLSDIASMGGTPQFALVSLGLPPELKVDYFDQLFEGIRDELSRFSAHLIGGNLTKTNHKLIVDITLLGEVHPQKILTRSGAKPGDKIFVTGKLGESGAGFQVLEHFGKEYPVSYDPMVNAHLQPIPRVEAGKLIADYQIATAMIDISDGLASDLNHICLMSNVGAEIYQDQLPLSDQLFEISQISNKSPLEFALHSGEDYELLFTIRPEVNLEKLKEIGQKLSLPITEIGRIINKNEGFLLINTNNKRLTLKPKGWDHFAKKSGG
jgi:thiamine-monophosphate kinase